MRARMEVMRVVQRMEKRNSLGEVQAIVGGNK